MSSSTLAHPALRVVVVHRGHSPLSRQLGARGFDVVEVDASDDVLRVVDETRPHAIVADVDAGDGLALCAAVRGLPDYGRTVPVLALAHGSNARLQPSVAGFCAVLPASCSPSALASALCRAIVAVAGAANGGAGTQVVRTLGFARARRIRPQRGITVTRAPREEPEE